MPIVISDDFASGKIGVILSPEYISEFVDACDEAGLDAADADAKYWFQQALEEHDVVAFQQFGALDGSWYDESRRDSWHKIHPHVTVLTWNEFINEVNPNTQNLESILDLL